MQVEFINPFLSATQEVFSTMLSCELTRGPLGLKQNRSPAYEVSGLIRLQGIRQGMVVVSLGRQTAIRTAEVLLRERHETLNAEIFDAIGEITSLIAEAAKSQLEPLQLSVGLPTVICGKNHIIGFPSNSQPVTLPFHSLYGPICVEVGLCALSPV